VSGRGKQDDSRERDEKLDAAIEMTFPASDPIAVGRPTGAKVAQGAKAARAVSKRASPATEQKAPPVRAGGRMAKGASGPASARRQSGAATISTRGSPLDSDVEGADGLG
jgi:hypothetical protein